MIKHKKQVCRSDDLTKTSLSLYLLVIVDRGMATDIISCNSLNKAKETFI